MSMAAKTRVREGEDMLWTKICNSKNVAQMSNATVNSTLLTDHPRLYPDPLTNTVIHVEESANRHSGLGGLAGDP